MNNLGQYIREQREKHELTIEELSKRTLISPAVIKDIEAGKFDRYSGEEAYVKMYLKKLTQALEMDTEDVTRQYVELTREIELERIKEEELKQDFNSDIVEKGKMFSFSTPQVARRPSVYEEKTHQLIIRNVIILLLVVAIVGVLWFGLSSTKPNNDGNEFKPQNGTNVDGDINTDQNLNQNQDNNQLLNPQQGNIQFNRVGELEFEMVLPANIEEFKFKVEFGSKSWAKLNVNGELNNEFVSTIYEQGDVVEITLNKSTFKDLDLRNGYSMGHRYFINDQEIPLTEDDYSEGTSNFKVVLKDELTQ